ncbi:MAG: 3',5'-cyclic-nucleotide phosphodiesterase [Myxococcota bacterium]
MKIRVLGCHGGTSPDHRTTCFMLGEHLAVDAGAICSGLSLDEQLNVDDILLSHSHLDHIHELAILADNVANRRKSPVNVHCTQATADALKKHFLNNVMWPDFTAIPSASSPTLKVKVHPHGRKFQVQNFEVTAVPMKHPVESTAYLIKDEGGTVVFSGDTGPSTALWEQVNKLKDVRALFIECSFPNSLQKVADVSGHLTPQTMSGELKKLTVSGFPVVAYHLKPPTFSETRKELRALKMRELHLARVGDIFEV